MGLSRNLCFGCLHYFSPGTLGTNTCSEATAEEMQWKVQVLPASHQVRHNLTIAPSCVPFSLKCHLSLSSIFDLDREFRMIPFALNLHYLAKRSNFLQISLCESVN